MLTIATPALRQAVITEAERWIGTPFVTHAAVRGAGVACGPLLLEVYGALGIPVPTLADMGHFPLDWHLHTREERYLNILLKYTREIETPEKGDIAMIRFGRVFSHSAIVVEWPRVIHAMFGRGVEWSNASKPPLGRNGRAVKFLSPFQS